MFRSWALAIFAVIAVAFHLRVAFGEEPGALTNVLVRSGFFTGRSSRMVRVSSAVRGSRRTTGEQLQPPTLAANPMPNTISEMKV